jgi:hypothetical protein
MEAGRKALEHRAQGILGPNKTKDAGPRRALDSDFPISADGEAATVAGEMEVVIVRPAHDGGTRFWLTIRLPDGEELDVR